ncbi:hemerythrin domain-containing protein [Pseudofrankia asymbiotica]|uniref:Hemerythrin-like domain-containing protein n=1 Tax=Pseudofrankia asymbiotica TaxID=1834516 RepID=A0A1V2I625_9ACTN|nr:hemerythrin domain-containing protein [Pseudofrankia asymbiotica]ONH25243.1 hypothetical protein BL253_28160 [Pseudofrankia asymbiotica]
MATQSAPFDGREMYLVHTMLRREFGLGPGLVHGASDGDPARARVLVDHIALVSTVLHHHHGAEDAYVWPLLVDRLTDQATPLVDLMESQHREVTRLGRAADAAADRWLEEPTAVARETFAHILGELRSALWAHLAAEEEQVVPLMEKAITMAEWNRIVEMGAAGANPDELPLGFGMLMYEGDPEVIDAAIANMPAPVRDVIRRAAPRAFAEHARLVHGTVTPPRSTEL